VEQFRIVFHDEEGNPLDRDDIRKVTGRVSYQIVSDQEVIPEAKAFHDQGRAAGQRGEHGKAIQLFAKATEVDPDWPYPVYDAAFAFLLNGDAETAEEYYRRVDRLAPRGFFTTKVAVDSLRREREGSLPSGAYLAFVMLEWEDAERRRSVLQALLQDSPEFPAAWKLFASMIESPGERLEAIEQGLSHSPDASTRGGLLIQKAVVLSDAGRKEEAAVILRQVSADPECTLDNEAMASLVLALNLEQE
jgi:tetratricopeptide (TPR) repeat protein